MSPDEANLGRASFVDRHGLWTTEQIEAAAEVIDLARADGLEVMRFSFAESMVRRLQTPNCE